MRSSHDGESRKHGVGTAAEENMVKTDFVEKIESGETGGYGDSSELIENERRHEKNPVGNRAIVINQSPFSRVGNNRHGVVETGGHAR